MGDPACAAGVGAPGKDSGARGGRFAFPVASCSAPQFREREDATSGGPASAREVAFTAVEGRGGSAEEAPALYTSSKATREEGSSDALSIH